MRLAVKRKVERALAKVTGAWFARTRAVLGFLRRWDKDALERAQLEARKAEQRLAEAIDVLPEGIVILDGDGRYILWNRKYAEIYHRSADLFAKGRRLADTLKIGVARGDYPDAVGREETWIAERLALLKNPGVRHEQRVADGRWLMIEEKATSDGGVIGIRVDITEMKEQSLALRQALARAEAANKAKSDFLANMSHEVRTPLNGVLGLASMLDQTSLDADQRDMVRTIIASANTLDALLGDILTHSRLESGRLELNNAPFRLRQAAQEALGLFRPQFVDKGLELQLDLSADADVDVIGDVARFKQILSNLVSNALKFTAEGGVKVRLGVAGQGETLRHVLEVSDTGIGFEPEDAARLFVRFEQADSSITRRYGGTGLGLAICSQLADLMGGAITASGRPGKGATFTVELPLPLAEPSGAVAPDAPLARAREGLRILAAEDNPTNRKVVELMLGSIGAAVDCVENGMEAVEAVRSGDYDLGLIDLQMPVMDGLSAIRAIRAEEAALGRPRLPLVVLSANVMPEHLAASKAAGADGHIGKPVRVADLLAAVMEAVNGPPSSTQAELLRAG
jgi:signal transduction histidine kinase/CheY-like chemotaxis protein